MTKSEREVVFLNRETAPVVYVNNAEVSQSPYDVRMTLGTLIAADAEKLVTQVAVVVYMALPHAKVFADILNKQIARYEAQYGPVPSADRLDKKDDEAGDETSEPHPA